MSSIDLTDSFYLFIKSEEFNMYPTGWKYTPNLI